MNKLTLTLILVAVLILIGGITWTLISAMQNPNPNSQGSLNWNPFLPAGSQTTQSGNVPATNPQTNGKTIQLLDQNGTLVTANDFLSDTSVGKYPSSGYYYIGYHTSLLDSNTEGATTTLPYLITYIAETQYFNIELLKEPIGEVRQAAEGYLMTQLGVSEDDMCRLQYMVSVPWLVSEVYSGRSLGFSFCPGAVPLPTN